MHIRQKADSLGGLGVHTAQEKKAQGTMQASKLCKPDSRTVSAVCSLMREWHSLPVTLPLLFHVSSTGIWRHADHSLPCLRCPASYQTELVTDAFQCAVRFDPHLHPLPFTTSGRFYLYVWLVVMFCFLCSHASSVALWMGTSVCWSADQSTTLVHAETP